MNAIVITGASGGIGEAFARRFAADKNNLFLVARREEKLRKLCEELQQKHQVRAYYLALDLSEKEADLKLFTETQRLGLEVSVLINNAGIGSTGYFEELPLESELDMLRLNTLALVAITHRFLPQMRIRKKGSIINVSSTASFQPVPFMAAYSASKVFVRYFSASIAAEYAPYNIQVMALCPGATETQFFDNAKMGQDARGSLGLNQTQTPEEVVDAAMKGIKKENWTVISGVKNNVLSRMSSLLPSKLIAKAIAKRFRVYFEK